MNDDPGRKVIQEAAGSYLQALYAIREFRREVQERCTPVVKNRLKELEKCTGVPMDEKRLRPWANPDKLANWDEEYANIGVKVEARKEVIFYYVLGWELSEDQSPSNYVLASVWVSTGQAAAYLLDGLKKTGNPQNLDREGNEVYIWQPVDAGHIGDFDQLLDQIIGEWCQLWRNAGGLDKLIPVSSVQSLPPAP